MADRGDLLAMADSAAQRHGIPPRIFHGLVSAESNWDPQAIPRDQDGNVLSSAKGLTQLVDGTAAAMGVRDPFDPAQNLEGGAKYLSQLYDHFGDWDTAIAAYHDGPGKVAREGITDDTGRPYLERVKKHIPADADTTAPATGVSSARTAAPQGWTLEPASAPSAPQGWTLEPAEEHGLLATGAHYAAKALPVAGAVLGAIPGAAAGTAVGLPTGPGALAAGAVGAGLGAAAGGAAGKGLQHVIDTALGYEQPIQTAADLGSRVKDMATEGAEQGAGTAVGTAAIGVLAPVLSKVAGPIKDFAINQGRRVLTGGANTLKTTAALSPEIVDEAFEQGAIKPFYSQKNAAAAMAEARQKVGDTYGRIVASLASKGFTGPEAELLAQQLAAEGSAVGADSMNPAVENVFGDAADRIGSRPVDGNGKLGLQQAESLKRSSQGMARSSYSRLEPTEVGDAHEAVASTLRQANEDAIAQQAAGLNDPATKAIADNFVPVKQQLARIIPAANAADKGAAQAAARRMLSPSDYAAYIGGGAPAAALNHVLRTRGTSTVAWAAKGVAEKLQTLAASNPARLGKYAAVLVPALQKSPEDFNAHMFVLGQTDPGFQEMSRKVAEDGQ